jgi:hypothetical protein
MIPSRKDEEMRTLSLSKLNLPATVFSFLIAFAAAGRPQSPPKVTEPRIAFNPQSCVCARAVRPVQIDGELDEDVWSKVSWSENFGDIEGPSRPRPRYRTMIKLLWDDAYFYVGGYLEEPNLWASMTERDSIIYQDNDFEIYIDPDGDTHNYYEIDINALNTVRDVFLVAPYRDGGPAIEALDVRGLKTAVKVSGTLNDPADKDRGWFVEAAIPWEVLKEAAFPKSAPKPGDQWRMNFSRVEYRLSVEEGKYVKAKDAAGKALAEDNWTWTPIGVINIHYPEMWGYVQFSGKIAGLGRDRFEDRPAEKAKWALRKIYYAEWALRSEKGVFSGDSKILDLREKDLRIRGYGYPPLIQTTADLFEASYKEEGAENWHIREDGTVWKEM